MLVCSEYNPVCNVDWQFYLRKPPYTQVNFVLPRPNGHSQEEPTKSTALYFRPVSLKHPPAEEPGLGQTAATGEAGRYDLAGMAGSGGRSRSLTE